MTSDYHEKYLVRVGSRKSQLALAQTNNVIDELADRNPKTKYEIFSMSTIGDKILDTALAKIGEKSLFTKELEMGLAAGDFDFIVHSCKDLPTTLPDGMIISAISKRYNPADVVIMHKNHQNLTLNDLPVGSVIGTSSVRRSAQLKRNFPHLRFKDIRGNLNTRLSKLDDHDTYKALVLAAAGIIRLGWSHRISQILTPDECLYAAGQGALAVESREDDPHTMRYLSELSDETTLLCCIAERAYLKKLDGGCSAPVGVHSNITANGVLEMIGGVFSLDGMECLKSAASINLYNPNNVESEDEVDDDNMSVYCGIVSLEVNAAKMAAAEKVGLDLAGNLLNLGAYRILQQAKHETHKDINKAPQKVGNNSLQGVDVIA